MTTNTYDMPFAEGRARIEKLALGGWHPKRMRVYKDKDTGAQRIEFTVYKEQDE